MVVDNGVTVTLPLLALTVRFPGVITPVPFQNTADKTTVSPRVTFNLFDVKSTI